MKAWRFPPFMDRTALWRFAASRTCALLVLSGMLAGVPASLQAQEEAVSREVVQALPSAQVASLNQALRQLARNPRNLSALIAAGNASLELGDNEAALGFFGRAQDVSPSNADAKLGLAAVFMRSDRPVEALRYFSEAELAGASTDRVASDRGLAYDLVGQHWLAQESYRTALTRGEDAQARRRLALSYAIVGDRPAFDETLRPLMMDKDLAAYRTRAFGLAILGDMNEAKGLVRTVIPRDLSSRIIPYLEFMPRLTGSQQAAAGNLGVFPKAAEIGRDNPAILRYRAQPADAAQSDQSESADAPSPVTASRNWVQIAAGRNRQALMTDWTRTVGKAGGLLGTYKPHVVAWGRMNRLLAGPVENKQAAQELVRALAGAGIESFAFTSVEGEKIEQLQ